jgi:hypothetical protein
MFDNENLHMIVVYFSSWNNNLSTNFNCFTFVGPESYVLCRQSCDLHVFLNEATNVSGVFILMLQQIWSFRFYCLLYDYIYAYA